MNEKDIVSLSSSKIRAKSFRISSGQQNYTQYAATVKAYALAGMPFEHIANAGDFLGDPVERGEIDAPILTGWQELAGEVTEDKSKILSWQNRGEIISITPQLSSLSVTGQETVTNPDQTRDVVEGIGVFNQTDNSQLMTNPYLKAPAGLKKAA